ncbi:hypothetical protein CkaCkLH20_08980 [Colletotrichum karsti]|uniref:Uncharacterized protein n=1 Tax=Colletotrichum karsti TaxID=1095194 RepID=A0A9P6I242_9PEZI|nr:uncharacterized protein CkaCkLH20_08980 [Colletotrichum karsti]KAF9873521.1 hypothetical protein CkaCkLH20_08980 [Colletotrichum karsti]
MVAEREQSPSSTSAKQGSVTSNLESSSSSAAAARDFSAQRTQRLNAFLQDQAFDVGSGNGDDVGSRQIQHAREQRLKGLVASVDAHFQNVGADNASNNASDGASNNGGGGGSSSSSSSSSNDADTQMRRQPHGQYHARKDDDVRGTGEQFPK